MGHLIFLVTSFVLDLENIKTYARGILLLADVNSEVVRRTAELRKHLATEGLNLLLYCSFSLAPLGIGNKLPHSACERKCLRIGL